MAVFQSWNSLYTKEINFLAKKSPTQKPRALLTLIDADKTINPRESFKVSPAFVYCLWLEPIPTIGLTLNDLDALKEKAYRQIWQHLHAHKIANVA